MCSDLVSHHEQTWGPGVPQDLAAAQDEAQSAADPSQTPAECSARVTPRRKLFHRKPVPCIKNQPNMNLTNNQPRASLRSGLEVWLVDTNR